MLSLHPGLTFIKSLIAVELIPSVCDLIIDGLTEPDFLLFGHSSRLTKLDTAANQIAP